MTHIKQLNIFITSRAVDIIRTVYYIQCPWGDENIFAVLYMSICYGLTHCYKTAVFLTFMTWSIAWSRCDSWTFCSFSFVLNVCVLMGQAKTFHILRNTIPPNLFCVSILFSSICLRCHTVPVRISSCTIRYDSVMYLTCSEKLTSTQLSLPHRINQKLKNETKNKMTSVIGPVQLHYHEAVQ